MSTIAWTEKTWNPIVGCSKVSAGCDHCYASQDSPHRFPKVYDREGVVVIRGTAKKPGLTWVPRGPDGKSLGKGAQWTGELRLLPHVLDKPLRRKKPTTYFVNSLSDIFHESLVDCEEGRRFISAIFGVMAACPQHTFQLLTKRPGKAREWFAWAASQRDDEERGVNLVARVPGISLYCHAEAVTALEGVRLRIDSNWPLAHVWIGTSVEDQRAADERIPELLQVPAALRFLSVEPLLGPVDLGGSAPIEFFGLTASTRRATSDGATAPMSIDWVICGGESGAKARPCEVSWIRSIVRQCKAAGVACFVKQIGSKPVPWDKPLAHSKGGDMAEWPEDLRVQQMPGETIDLSDGEADALTRVFGDPTGGRR